jgi:two-component system OmpR family response regulator
MNSPSDGRTVLMIEDDHGVRAILTLYLEKLGFRVFEAASREEARSIWQEQIGMIDVVVGDIVLPDGNGADLVQEFRLERPDLKVVMISGGVPAPIGGFSASDRPFLPKPFAPEVLVEAIAAEYSRCAASTN